jgi:dienelactone hydrolase
VEITAKDADGASWAGVRSLRADGSGRLVLPRDLLTSMTTASLVPTSFVWPASAVRFHVAVVSDGRKASRTFERSTGLIRTRVPGVSGLFYARRGASARPALLVFGGSEGGRTPFVDALAQALATHGYPTLAIGYFGLPGRPATLDRIPLEYFARAAHWLASRPEVARRHVLALGISRGSEAAQLLAVHYPTLIHGVVAVVPSNVTFLSPSGGVAWTLGGKALPYSKQWDDPDPTDVPDAVIPDEKIRGPVLTICGRIDTLWPSCPFARAIVRRLDAHHDRSAHRAIETDGGHYVGTLVPYQPSTQSSGEAAADERARERIWPEILDFLKEHA